MIYLLSILLIFQQVPVGIKQTFDFQNLLQFSKRSFVAVMLSGIAAVLLGQGTGIIDELFIPVDVMRDISSSFPTYFPEMEGESGCQ